MIFSDRSCVFVGAIAASNFQQMAIEAHQIKGASANIGAKAMHCAAEQLEQLAWNHEHQGTTKLITELENLVNQIQVFLTKR
ncbi:Hpt domain-containing protein [Nostoc sp. CHAB 5844]|nr:Hpt domain-containing protein [Nostoc sp. CHAB 5844]